MGRSPSKARPAATPIISCSRMPTLNTRSWRGSSETPISASTMRRARIVVERARGALVEALAHGGHRATSATTTCGARAGRCAAPARSRRGRGRRRAPRSSPRARSAPRPRRASGRSTEWLSTTIAVRRPSPRRPASWTASQLLPSSSSASPTRQNDPRPLAPARLEAERRADRDRQAVAERAARDLDARARARGRGGSPAASRSRRSRRRSSTSMKPFAARTA